MINKRIYWCVLTLSGLLPVTLWAQPPAESPVCGIYYDYDVLGNRIERSYACHFPWEGEVGTVIRKVSISLYPTPTAGSVTASFDALVSSAELKVFTIASELIGTVSCSSCYEIRYDFGDAVPGTYVMSFMIVREDNEIQEESLLVVKIA